MDDPQTEQITPTRRTLLRRGLALSVAAPALAALLQVSTASADPDDTGDPDDRPNPPPRSTRARLEPFTSDLITVAQSASSGDFVSGNAGTDPLTDGRVALRRTRADSTGEGRLRIELRGAAANVSYDAFFQPFQSGKGRESLGTIGPTNDAGNLNAESPSALSGLNRVGIFVIVRHDGSDAGKDEFVSSLGG